MFSQDELAIVRRAFAKQVVAKGGAADARIEQALATIPREAFLGAGPWRLGSGSGPYRLTPSADPAYLYQDATVAIVAEKHLDNGLPSFLASLISVGRLQAGEHAVHVGAGVGYYTAVLAVLAGPSGRVTAIEVERDLARRAATNLAGWDNVQVIEGDGAAVGFEPADLILVNAGAAEPAAAWLDGLRDGGRLVLPLTVSRTYNGRPTTTGAIFLIRRDGHRYSARSIGRTAIYPCAGMRGAQAEQALAAAFERGGSDRVTWLDRSGELPDERCWLRGDGWAFAYS